GTEPPLRTLYSRFSSPPFRVSSSGALCRKDILLAINDLVFLFSITMPLTKVPLAISNLEIMPAITVNESSTAARRGPRHAP
ncbi:hypothetical protein ACLOJK_022764, partial [Asimina triloba]